MWIARIPDMTGWGVRVVRRVDVGVRPEKAGVNRKVPAGPREVRHQDRHGEG